MNDLNNILLEIIFILLHFFLFVLNYKLFKKNLFSPAVLFALVWFVILTLHLLFRFTILNGLLPLRPETFLVLFLGALFFSAGSFLVTVSVEKSEFNGSLQMQPPVNRQEISLALRIIFLAIVVIALPFYIQAAYRVFLASNVSNFFVGLRLELSYGDEDIGITKYFTFLSFFVFAINYYALLTRKNKLNKLLFVFSLIVSLTYSVFATGRTYYFIILSIYLGIKYLHDSGFSIKKFIWPLLIFMVLFMAVGIVYNKGGNTENTFRQNLHSSAEVTGLYLVSSLNALDLELANNVKATYPGENTLLFFVKLLHSFGYIPNTNEGTLVSEFVFVPYPTNVFTIYSPYIRDWGKLYAWIMVAFYGALHTWLFLKAFKTKSIRYTLYYSFLLYPLLLSFFQEQYLSLLSTWLQAIFYIEIFLALNNLLTHRRAD